MIGDKRRIRTAAVVTEAVRRNAVGLFFMRGGDRRCGMRAGYEHRRMVVRRLQARLAALPAIAIAGCVIWMLLPQASDAESRSAATPSELTRVTQNTSGARMPPPRRPSRPGSARRFPAMPTRLRQPRRRSRASPETVARREVADRRTEDFLAIVAKGRARLEGAGDVHAAQRQRLCGKGHRDRLRLHPQGRQPFDRPQAHDPRHREHEEPEAHMPACWSGSSTSTPIRRNVRWSPPAEFNLCAPEPAFRTRKRDRRR